ncbi:uncharacterized protein LOC132752946 [Ruditapes philippinarum]|uniref:uncharacterized protein LOC132752946 n=1 Tax=Ruditapes philippinarum TaxID=129788 RepID=UPI00295ADAC2|nr:uncharacterized protein LOC132752946 [Ruditapes philippinarum]
MSVIIRLQGLSWSASAMDIRNFFKGLSIPPGGVRIIGGDNGDAFIAFSTDEDARQAMMLTNKPLNDSPVQLFLSSKTEMQNTISQAKDKSTSVTLTDATPMNNETTLSQQIPSVQQISRAFPAVGQIMGTLGIQPPQSMHTNQPGSGNQQSITPHGTLQQPSGVFGFINKQQQNVQSNVGKQFEHDLPGEYSVGGFQGINKQSEIKPNNLGQYGMVGKLESHFHTNEMRNELHPGNKNATTVQNTFSNPGPQNNFHGEVYFPQKLDMHATVSQSQSWESNFQQKNLNQNSQNTPYVNPSRSSSGHGNIFQSDQMHINKNIGGHGKQLKMEHFDNLPNFANLVTNAKISEHANFPQIGRQGGPNIPPGNANFPTSSMPFDPHFPPGNRSNDPYNPPSDVYLKNQPNLSAESRFSQGVVDRQSNVESSLRQNFPVLSPQDNTKLPATSRSFDQTFTKSGMTETSAVTPKSRQSRFSPANMATKGPSDSLSQPKVASSLTGSTICSTSEKKDKIDQGRCLTSGKSAGNLVLSNKQDEFGRNLPFAGRDSKLSDSSRTPTRDEKLEETSQKDKITNSRFRESNRTSSRERDRSRDRSNRRDSPRDRRERDRERPRRDRDDERRSRRDRDRDNDRKTRDRDNERYDRSRDRDPRRSPSINSIRKTRKRSLSPTDKNKYEKEKKFQTEKSEPEKKDQIEKREPLNVTAKEMAANKEERSAIPPNYGISSLKDTEKKNSNGIQALFPVVPPSKPSKGLLGEAPAALTGFGNRNMVQHGGPLLDTPVGHVTNDSRMDEFKPKFGFREDKILHSAMDISSHPTDMFGGQSRDEHPEAYEYDNSREMFGQQKRDRSKNDENYRDPYYLRDDDLNRDKYPERFRHPLFFNRNQHDMNVQPNKAGSFEHIDREHTFDDRRPPGFKGINRSQENLFDNNLNRTPFFQRNQDFQGRPSLLGDGGVQHEFRERHREESEFHEFQRSANEMPGLFDDIQDRKRPDYPRNERGLPLQRGPENLFRNEPSFGHTRDTFGRDDQNEIHRGGNDPNFYEIGGPHDERFNPEQAGFRNIRPPLRGRGFRGHGFNNMRGGFNGPPNRFDSQEDRGKGHFEQERGNRFSNIEEQPLNIERRDFDRLDRHDNRSFERYQDRRSGEGRSKEQDRNDKNIESHGDRFERDRSKYAAGRGNETGENRNRDGKSSIDESSTSLESKVNDKNQYETISSEKNFVSMIEPELMKKNALCSVVLENIPVETTYKDIRKLFAGLELSKDGIKIINDNEGKRIGKAYVRFGTQESFKKGLQKDRSRLGNKVIVIKPVPRRSFDSAIDSYLPPDDDDDVTPDIDMCNSLSATLRALKGEPELKLQKKSTASQNDLVVKITLLPEYAKVQNIKSYFQNDFKIANNGEAIVIESSRFKACTGLCYVEFADEKSFQKAIDLNRMFERKTIKIAKGSKKDMDELRDKMKNNAPVDKDANSNVKDAENKSKEVSSSDSKATSASNSEQSKPSSPVKLSPACICVRVQNIPKSLKVFELRNLFEGVGVNVRVAQICHDAVGKAIGEGYLEFTSNVEVQKCLVKNGTFINKNKITVLPVTKPEMIENMRLLRQSLQPETPTSQAVFYYVKAEQLPKNVSTGEIMNFFSGYNPAPESIRLNIGENKDQPNCSTALVGFRSRGEAERAIAATNGNILRNQTIKLSKVVL